MRKFNKKLASLLLGAAIAITTLAAPAFAADSSITYEGGAEKFVFVPGSNYSDTDLFDNFKGVMPGDSLEQKITIKNNYKGSDYVKIYLRAEVHDDQDNPMSPEVAKKETLAEMKDFLSQLSMEIAIGDKVIYKESPDQLGGLAENVLLGSFRRGVSAELTVKLNVPIELDDKYAERVGEVDWVFTVEERKDSNGGGGGGSKPKPKPDTPQDEIVIITPDEVPLSPGDFPGDLIAVAPKTGDDMNIWPYVILLGVGVAGLFLVMFGKRKDEQKS